MMFRRCTSLSVVLWLMAGWGSAIADSAPVGPVPLAHATVATTFGLLTQSAYGFWEGRAGPRLYVYFDPNCIYCHKLYEALQPELAHGQVRVYWIPVGFLKRSSPGKAARFLIDPDPVADLATNERGFNEKTEEGALKPLPRVWAELEDELTSNVGLLKTVGPIATPTLVYWDKRGAAQVVPGMPVDLKGLIADMGHGASSGE